MKAAGAGVEFKIMEQGGISHSTIWIHANSLSLAERM
jgi:hypothetical protein